MYYRLSPGRRLGWHSNSAEEVQFVVRGSGELLREQGTHPISSGDLFLVEKDERHDVRNLGREDLCVLAFFPDTRIEHVWRDQAWPPDGRQVTTTGSG